MPSARNFASASLRTISSGERFKFMNANLAQLRTRPSVRVC